MSKATTCSTTAGVFTTRAAAEQAIAQLKAAGYRDDQIGLVGKDPSGKTVRSGREAAGHAGEGAAAGAAAGAVAGAATVAGVGAAVMMGVIPVVGPILALGPLAVTLLNAAGGAAGGAAIGSIAGALIGWGVPEEDAKYYEQQVQAGRYLVTVECGEGNDARDLIMRHGGYDRVSAPVI